MVWHTAYMVARGATRVCVVWRLGTWCTWVMAARVRDMAAGCVACVRHGGGVYTSGVQGHMSGWRGVCVSDCTRGWCRGSWKSIKGDVAVYLGYQGRHGKTVWS